MVGGCPDIYRDMDCGVFDIGRVSGVGVGSPASPASGVCMQQGSGVIPLSDVGRNNGIPGTAIGGGGTRLRDLDGGPMDRGVLSASNILVFDIETLPAVVHTYDLRTRYISPKNVIEPGALFSWAAQWYHEPTKVRYRDLRSADMLPDLWRLLDHASYVVGYNSDRFDLRKVRGYFAREGLPPFRPAKSIDLIRTIRTLGFESASLDYAARMFGVRRKVDNGGAANWERCLAGDPKAWKLMRQYNTGDVRTTTELLDAVRPWIVNHPYMGFAAADDDGCRCPRCGSTNTRKEGVVQAVVIRYRQHRCLNCKGLYRSTLHHRAGYTRAL